MFSSSLRTIVALCIATWSLNAAAQDQPQLASSESSALTITFPPKVSEPFDDTDLEATWNALCEDDQTSCELTWHDDWVLITVVPL